MDNSSFVPKIEKENPSMLDISEHLLPIIKDWEVGKRYLIKLEAENVAINKGSMYDPNDKNEVRSSFRVLGAESLDMGKYDDGKTEMREKISGKRTFIQKMIKPHKKTKSKSKGETFIRTAAKVNEKKKTSGGKQAFIQWIAKVAKEYMEN